MKYVVHKNKEPYDVYVGRGSQWGNPFSHLSNSKARIIVPTRREAVIRYWEYLYEQDDLLKQIWKLKGKVLGCWCDPEPLCHAHILAALANDDYQIPFEL